MDTKHTQDALLQQNLDEFYQNNNNMQQMLDIVTGASHISLRIVDWFTTNYSKKFFTIYDTHDNKGNVKRFKVYNDYKLRLKSYSKKRFDPFCRWNRINMPYDTQNCIETTIGQLNFFKWAIENKVITYIHNHYQEIELDMNSRNTSISNRNKPNPDTKTRKKRKEISTPAQKSIQKEHTHITISFK